MLAEAKKQLNQNLRSLHLPTIRCHEEQARLASPRPTNTTSMKWWSSRWKPGARIGSFDIYENRSCRWKRVGKRLSASDCPGKLDVRSTLCSKARSSTGTRTSSRSAIPVAGRHTLVCGIAQEPRPSRASSSVYDVQSFGSGAVGGETRATSCASVETESSVRSSSTILVTSSKIAKRWRSCSRCWPSATSAAA